MSDLIITGISGVVSGATDDDSTAADLFEEVKQHFYAGGREQRNKLAAAIDNDDTTLAFTYPLGSINAGAKLSVDLEDMVVWQGTPAVIVERGQFGSTAISHALGALVTVNAKITDWEIFRAMNRVVGGLSSPAVGIFQMKTADLTFNPAFRGYDLAGVSDLQGQPYGLIYQQEANARDWRWVENWSYADQLNAASFSSTRAVFIDDPLDSLASVRVVYKAALGRLESLTDVVTLATGLRPQALDLLTLGTVLRLSAGREIKRNFFEEQGDTRRADEVPPGANLQAPNALRALFRERTREEAARLYVDFPERKPRYRNNGALTQRWR